MHFDFGQKSTSNKRGFAFSQKERALMEKLQIMQKPRLDIASHERSRLDLFFFVGQVKYLIEIFVGLMNKH